MVHHLTSKKEKKGVKNVKNVKGSGEYDNSLPTPLNNSINKNRGHRLNKNQ